MLYHSLPLKINANMHTVETRHSFPHLDTRLVAFWRNYSHCTMYFLHFNKIDRIKNMMYNRQMKQARHIITSKSWACGIHLYYFHVRLWSKDYLWCTYILPTFSGQLCVWLFDSGTLYMQMNSKRLRWNLPPCSFPCGCLLSPAAWADLSTVKMFRTGINMYLCI